MYGKSTSIVLPYVRALIGNDGQPLNRAMLATQIQIAAGLGTEGSNKVQALIIHLAVKKMVDVILLITSVCGPLIKTH